MSKWGMWGVIVLALVLASRTMALGQGAPQPCDALPANLEVAPMYQPLVLNPFVRSLHHAGTAVSGPGRREPRAGHPRVPGAPVRTLPRESHVRTRHGRPPPGPHRNPGRGSTTRNYSRMSWSTCSSRSKDWTSRKWPGCARPASDRSGSTCTKPPALREPAGRPRANWPLPWRRVTRRSWPAWESPSSADRSRLGDRVRRPCSGDSRPEPGVPERSRGITDGAEGLRRNYLNRQVPPPASP